MIIRPFNAAYLLLLAFAAGAVVLLWVLLRGQPERCRAAVLIALCAVNIIGFFVYKGFLSRDVQFLQASGLDRFNWFNELPLQLCNINMFLIPIGILTHRRSLLGFAFFVAPLGALMALVFPEAAFSGYSAAADAGILYHAHADPDLRVQPDNTGLLPASAEGSAGRHRGAFDDCICGIPCGPAAAAHRLSAGKLFLRVRAGHRRQYPEPALEVDTGAVFV